MSAMVRRLRNRRGVALVLTMFMFMVFLGLAAFVVDFGRMYLFRAQLQAAADGAALAGMFRESQSYASDAQDTAIAYAARHSVDTVAVPLAADDVLPGTWTSATGFQQGGLPWDSHTVDAVQVTVRYTGPYTLFGRALGFTTHNLSATAVAVRGSLGTSRCVRPFAIPYQVMLNQLTKAYGDGVFRDAKTYDLSSTDVAKLSSMGVTDSLYLKVSSITMSDTTAISPTGNFYAVDLPPIIHDGVVQGGQGNGAPPYTAAISGCTGDPVSVGDWLAPENGNMVGPTNTGISNLCPPSGVCDPAYKVVTAVWDSTGSPLAGCGNDKCFHVKYLGEFSILGYSSSVKSIYGYFNTLTTAGGFTPTPGPVQVIALVK